MIIDSVVVAQIAPKIVRFADIREAFKLFHNEDMRMEFILSPKSESDVEKNVWFKDNCPNQYLADCIKKVIRKAASIAKAAFLNQQVDRYEFMYLEACKLTSAWEAWATIPEVQETLLAEKRKLQVQFEFWEDGKVPALPSGQAPEEGSDGRGEEG